MMRERWDSRTAFLLAAIGSAVGLGNVWRFPYICYQNGGGAFLVPWLVALFTAGIPLMIMEYALGCLMQNSAPTSFSKINKKMEWVGWWALCVGFVVVVYYAVVMSWCLAYLFYSIKIAWGEDAKTFFFKEFLHLSEGPGILGSLQIPIAIGLFVIWAWIYLCIIKGPKSVGKIVFVTVPLPLILLLVFTLRGITLPGALKGLAYYLTPNFKALLKPGVWLAAYSQIFFSLSLGFGILIAYASYLPKNADIVNNAFMTSLCNCGTSFLAGFAVFSTLGYLAHCTGAGVEEVIKGGPGLAFVVYPTIIRLLPFGARVFGFLFFLLLLTLAVDSAFSLVEAVVAGKMDKWGLDRRKGNLLVCSVAFLLGLFFTTEAGLHWLDIVDHFVTNFGLVAVGLSQCACIAYIFGAERLRGYINKNSDFGVGRWWTVFLKVLVPVILLVLLLRMFAERIKVPYGDYPQWALSFGWALIVCLPILSLLLARLGRRDAS
jgi:NSS family neurotransmitter:Na+ symporter